MKPFAAIWTSLREWPWSGRLLRLAILLLPWQTRAFLPSPNMGGWPWEQGRWSLYATMLVILAAAVSRGIEYSRKDLPFVRKWRSLWPLALLVAFCLFPTLSWVATGQWLLQVALLTLFAALVYTDADLHASFGRWMLWALVPVAVLALFQTATQAVFASKWLGLASQYPLDRGVSVIETAGVRFLRAYGSFPHPNLLGGWMGLGIVLAVRESLQAVRWRSALGLVGLFSAAAYVSFSRSAWIALAMGLGALLLLVAGRSRARGRVVLFGAVCVAVFCGAFLWRPELVRTRLVSRDRLETRSLNERREGLRQAIAVVLPTYPWGTGLGAYRVGLDRACGEASCQVPAEPPHFVPLLALAELGFVRFLAAGGALAGMVWRARRRFDSLSAGCFGGALLVLLALDHYLWSIWAGQALLAVAVLLVLKPKTVTVRVLETAPGRV